MDEPAAHFGLGKLAAGARLTLRVLWPGGKKTEHAGVAPNESHDQHDKSEVQAVA